MSEPRINESISGAYPIQSRNNTAPPPATPLVSHAFHENDVALPILSTPPSPTNAALPEDVSRETAAQAGTQEAEEEELDFTSEEADSVEEAAAVKEDAADIKEDVGLEAKDAGAHSEDTGVHIEDAGVNAAAASDAAKTIDLADLLRHAASNVNVLIRGDDGEFFERHLSHADHTRDAAGIEAIRDEVRAHFDSGILTNVEGNKKVFYTRQPLSVDMMNKIQNKAWMHNGQRLVVEFRAGDESFDKIYHQLMDYFQKYIDYHANLTLGTSSQSLEISEKEREKAIEKRHQKGKAETQQREIAMNNENLRRQKPAIDTSSVQKRVENEKKGKIKKERQLLRKAIEKMQKASKALRMHHKKKATEIARADLSRRKSIIIKKDQIDKDIGKQAA